MAMAMANGDGYGKVRLELLRRTIGHVLEVCKNAIAEITLKKTMRNFREMIIWNQGIDLAVKIYQITKQLPSDERFGLTSQLNRAAVSIPSNIAEGCSRRSENDFARFLELSLGSAYEVETDLVIAEKIGYLKKEMVSDHLKQLQVEQRQIHNLINKLRR